MTDPILFNIEESDAFLKPFLSGIKPFVYPSIVEFLEKEIRLPKKGNAEPGLIKMCRTPYMRKVYEWLHPDSRVWKLVVMKGAQLSFTAAILNLIAYYMRHNPETILFVQKTKELARTFSENKLDPFLKANKTLLRLMAEDGGTDKKLTKEFIDGSINMVGAQRADDLRSLAIALLLMDECDSFTRNAEGQGLPGHLAEARLRTYKGNRQAFYVTTPTFDGRSFIQDEYNQAQARAQLYIPCQRCGYFQKIEFENIDYDENNPADVRGLRCIACQGLTEEHEKDIFLEEAEWRYDVDIPEEKIETLGIQISSLYSPLGWYSWPEATVHYTNAVKKNDDVALITFTNLVLGLPHKVEGDCADWETVQANARDYEADTIPDENILVLTCGVDVQGDRLEAQVWGFTPDQQRYSIAYEVFGGDTHAEGAHRSQKERKRYWDSGQVWNDLTDFINKTWEHPSGAQLPITLTMIDSGSGKHTATVYEYCSRFPFNKVRAIKGRGQLQTILSAPKDMYLTESGKRKKLNGKKFQLVGVNVVKSEIYASVTQSPPEDGIYPPGTYHFRDWGEEYFRQLCSNVFVLTENKSGASWTYVKENHENDEALDTTVYARAAFTAMKGDTWSKRKWDALRRMILAAAPKAKARQSKRQAEKVSKKLKKEKALVIPPIPQSASEKKREAMHKANQSIDLSEIRKKNQGDLLSSIKKRNRKKDRTMLRTGIKDF